MPPAHRDVPDDITPPGHEPVKYVVGPGDLTRGELRRLLADAGAGAAELSNLSRDDLVSVARARKLEGLEVSGTGAVEARARDFLAVFSRLDRTVALPPGAELGLVLEKVGEWCVVAETPQTTAVRVGDVLSEASERASLAAAQARRDALHSSTSSELLPEYKSEPPPPPIETPPSRGSSYRLPECSPAYAEPPPVVRATSAEELRERFRNVGLSDLSP